MESLPGYRGRSLTVLKDSKVEIGDIIEVKMKDNVLKGTLVPRYQYDDDLHIVVKLKSGYNIGIGINSIESVKKLASGEKPSFHAPAPPKPNKSLPKIPILATGGTIASRVDYRTGAVHPAISAEDLYSLLPELSEIARIEPEIILSLYSENLEPEHWQLMAERVAHHVNEGARGVVITSGTDIMGYTAAALSFALQDIPVPIFIVGSQRSSDRPSSDAYMNLIGSVSSAVKADFSGVFVAMHYKESDEKLAFHLGTRVRKNHTSTRDAFESIGVEPVAYWSRTGLEVKAKNLKPRRDPKGFRPKQKFERNIALVKFYPSLPPSIFDLLIETDVKGIIIEGSGLGHINTKCIPMIRECVKRGIIVCMTSQCIWGRIGMNVYDTGRDLLQAGVIPLEDMLPETALVKLMWVIANSSSIGDAKRLMRLNLAGEMTERSIL
jgi:glutamyl-tRNA(Gln) amidotransferase subunit D